jgi:Uma2 family endonuclease
LAAVDRTVPDWICEVVSTGNARYDQVVKARFHAEIGVPWL